jgi:hypothetical protein
MRKATYRRKYGGWDKEEDLDRDLGKHSKRIFRTY